MVGDAGDARPPLLIIARAYIPRIRAGHRSRVSKDDSSILRVLPRRNIANLDHYSRQMILK